MSTTVDFEDSTMDSGPIPLETRSISVMDFSRLERKLDRMTVAVEKLVLVEERQANQSITIAKIESTHEKDKVSLEKDIEANRVAIERNERLLQQWIQRGIGAWVVVTIVATLVGFILTRHA